MTRVLRLGMAIVATALATMLLGWWGVPLVAIVLGWSSPDVKGSWAGWCAVTAWGVILGSQMLFGAPLGHFGSMLAAAMSLPSFAPWVATLALAFVLAASATVLAREVRSIVAR